MRVDVALQATPNLLAASAGERAQVATDPGYRLLALRMTQMYGRPALDWQFVYRSSGQLLRVQDMFLNDAAHHDSFAVLTRARAAQWDRMAAQFAQLRTTLVMR